MCSRDPEMVAVVFADSPYSLIVRTVGSSGLDPEDLQRIPRRGSPCLDTWAAQSSLHSLVFIRKEDACGLDEAVLH